MRMLFFVHRFDVLVYTGKAWQWCGVVDVLKLLGFACLSNEWCSLLQATGECTTFAHWVSYPTDAVLQCKESVCVYFVSVVRVCTRTCVPVQLQISKGADEEQLLPLLTLLCNLATMVRWRSFCSVLPTCSKLIPIKPSIFESL